ncbi:Uma2 family endonuclease [Amorphoplanes digitatis]|uniref:Uma2 family endonuclease n=1 Tax=Actinoplanes digitatis TaxID=1868 RepID=A0A7W7HSE8_9ACTN|nr:Uma2 family endonuclease [Actinoplanes digitatis]MBB4759946.1 Uma2 family endonuclease [Actinoplanes digitatis]BFE67945.1 hypothetical protein GCM10020092_012460 [Actinoplanes digitatis]GID96494.1 hypothetical protein Adi01nite_59060 [Actinoplanes digitatis]
MTSTLINRSLPLEALATTEADYLHLGETSARTELWDGGVLACPRDTPRHQMILSALANALKANRTDLNVIAGVPVHLGPERIAVPDLIIAGTIDPDQPLVDARSVRLICEITSPTSATVDWSLKMHAYAQAGIPCYLVAEPERGLLHSYMLSAQGYVEQSVMQLVRVTGLNL